MVIVKLESEKKSNKKFYPKGKIVCISCGVFIIALVASVTILMALVNKEIVKDVRTINPDGITGYTFVVYRSGISSFQDDVANVFIDGLEYNDWKIDVTTSSSETPINISVYDLLVFGSPAYGSKPQNSILTYLDRVGDLNNTDIVILVTSGNTDNAQKILEDKVEAVDGNIIVSLSFYTDGENGGNVQDLSREAALNL